MSGRILPVSLLFGGMVSKIKSDEGTNMFKEYVQTAFRSQVCWIDFFPVSLLYIARRRKNIYYLLHLITNIFIDSITITLKKGTQEHSSRLRSGSSLRPRRQLTAAAEAASARGPASPRSPRREEAKEAPGDKENLVEVVQEAVQKEIKPLIVWDSGKTESWRLACLVVYLDYSSFNMFQS